MKLQVPTKKISKKPRFLENLEDLEKVALGASCELQKRPQRMRSIIFTNAKYHVCAP